MAKTCSPTARASAAHRDVLEPRGVLVLDSQQGQVGKLVEGNDPHLFVTAALQFPGSLVIDLDRDLRLPLDHVEISHQEAVLVDKKPGTHPAGGPHLDHRFAQFVGQVAHAAQGRRPPGGGIKPGLGHRGWLGLRRRANWRMGRRFIRRAGASGPRDLHDLAARDGQHRIADVHRHPIRFLGENLSDHGGLVFQLNRIGRRRLPARCRHDEQKDTLFKHRLKLLQRNRFDNDFSRLVCLF
jgi:hypothetical protein